MKLNWWKIGGVMFFTCFPVFVLGQAQYQVLYSFGADGFLNSGSSIDGGSPNEGLIFDRAGNIYGTTEEGGPVSCSTGYGCGTVFELSPQPGGGWAQTVLFNFCTSTGDPKTCPEGAYPLVGLLMDKAGNLYGTTDQGGTGFGVVFELSPPSAPGAAWTQTILFTAVCCGGGLYPDNQLTMDSSGNLYGTSSGGGVLGAGNVFELSPPGGQGGEWTQTVLYTFCQSGEPCTDGQDPAGGVVFDRAGNLYGATTLGGANSNGVIFELSPGGNGGWTETVLYTFDSSGQRGELPVGDVALDSEGNIYGSAFAGGQERVKYCDDWTKHCGGIFRLLKNANWKEQFFPFSGFNGGAPIASVYLDEPNRIAYGVTELGGAQAQGAVYGLTESSETLLYSFCSLPNCADGWEPGEGGALVKRGGNLYGTAQGGGTYGYGPGVVFEITQ